jgi:hypothetical protein
MRSYTFTGYMGLLSIYMIFDIERIYVSIKDAAPGIERLVREELYRRFGSHAVSEVPDSLFIYQAEAWEIEEAINMAEYRNAEYIRITQHYQEAVRQREIRQLRHSDIYQWVYYYRIEHHSTKADARAAVARELAKMRRGMSEGHHETARSFYNTWLR